MRSRTGTFAGAAAILLAAAACGGHSAAGIPTAQQPGHGTSRQTATARTEATQLEEYLAAQRQWAQCLREQGVNASDPDAKTGVVTFPANSKRDPKFTPAQQHCAGLLRPAPAGLEARTAPNLTPEQLDVARRYAACMQTSGAPDFPDPGPNGFGDTPWNQTTAGALKASRTCGPIVGETPGTPGKG
jgi:hypothetical protein